MRIRLRLLLHFYGPDYHLLMLVMFQTSPKFFIFKKVKDFTYYKAVLKFAPQPSSLDIILERYQSDGTCGNVLLKFPDPLPFIRSLLYKFNRR